MVRDLYPDSVNGIAPRFYPRSKSSKIHEQGGSDSDEDNSTLEDEQVRSYRRRNRGVDSPTARRRTKMEAFYDRIHTTKRLRRPHEEYSQAPRKRPRTDETVEADTQPTSPVCECDEADGFEQSGASDEPHPEGEEPQQHLVVSLKVPWHSGDERWQALLTREPHRVSQFAEHSGRQSSPSNMDFADGLPPASRGSELPPHTLSSSAVPEQHTDISQAVGSAMEQGKTISNQSPPCDVNTDHEASRTTLAQTQNLGATQEQAQSDEFHPDCQTPRPSTFPHGQHPGAAEKPPDGNVDPVKSLQQHATRETGRSSEGFAESASTHHSTLRSHGAVVLDEQSHSSLGPPTSDKTEARSPQPSVDPRSNTALDRASTSERAEEQVSPQKHACVSEESEEHTEPGPYELQTVEPSTEQVTLDRADAEKANPLVTVRLSDCDVGQHAGTMENDPPNIIDEAPSSSVEQSSAIHSQSEPLTGQTANVCATTPAQETLRNPASSVRESTAYTAGEAPQSADNFLPKPTLPAFADPNSAPIDSKIPSVSISDPSPAPDPGSNKNGSEALSAAPETHASILLLVDWKQKDDDPALTVTRLLRYTPQLWKALKADMPSAFVGKRLFSLVPGTVSMSANDVMQQYGEGIGDAIADEALEECINFLTNEAFGENADVPRIWRKATVTMRD